MMSCGLDGDDELRHHGKHLAAALLQHVVGALYREETVRVLLFPKAVEKYWQVVVVVDRAHVHLPRHLAAHRAVEDLDWQIAPVVETPEFRPRHGPLGSGACARRRRRDAPRLSA